MLIIDAVFVLGFPMGVVGQTRDYVVLRQAYLPALDSPYTVTSFLIDSLISPGNSGGPVVLKPEMAIEGTTLITKAYLIGVVKAYLPYTDVPFSMRVKLTKVTDVASRRATRTQLG